MGPSGPALFYYPNGPGADDSAGQLGTLTPTSGPSTTFGFDGVGERTSAATSGSATVGYTYNQADELTTSNNTPGGSASYSYDGNGLRASTTDSAGTHPSTWDTISASLPLLVSDGNNDYLYGPNDKAVEQINISSGTTTYLQQDREGSTRLITNTSGTVVGTKSYDAYGNVVATTGTTTSPLGYDGEYTDLSGLVYLRARYYDPATGQFLNVDGLVSTTHAPYAYASGNPVNETDPTGGRPETPDEDPYGYTTESTAPAPVPFRPDTGHIFRQARGHVSDTPANRTLLQKAIKPENFVSETLIDGGEVSLYEVMLPDGRQVWVQVRNGAEITNGGVNILKPTVTGPAAPVDPNPAAANPEAPNPEIPGAPGDGALPGVLGTITLLPLILEYAKNPHALLCSLAPSSPQCRPSSWIT